MYSRVQESVGPLIPVLLVPTGLRFKFFFGPSDVEDAPQNFLLHVLFLMSCLASIEQDRLDIGVKDPESPYGCPDVLHSDRKLFLPYPFLL